MVSSSGLLSLLCFLGLLASYAVILCHVKGHSSEGMKKALSTCTTHIIIVFLMFGPAIFIYTHPFRAFPADKVVSLFHTVIFPLMNPVIYTLRNQEVKASMRRLLSQHMVCWMQQRMRKARREKVHLELFIYLLRNQSIIQQIMYLPIIPRHYSRYMNETRRIPGLVGFHSSGLKQVKLLTEKNP